MKDTLLSGLVFILGGIAGVLFLLRPMMSRAKSTGVAGVLKIKKHRYAYEMADGIVRFGGMGVFTGTDIHLPKHLPHIFFDAYAGQRPAPPAEFMLPEDERIAVKGDETDGFTVFASKASKQLVQTIFTPELVRELQGTSYRYDIEVFDRHVRIIVPVEDVYVGGNKILQDDMVKTAKIFMKALDSRLETWRDPASSKKPKNS